MSGRKQIAVQLSIAVAGAFLALAGLRAFNQYVLMRMYLPLRMAAMIITQWIPFLAAGILMRMNKETFAGLGLRKGKIARQIGIGILLACVMSLVLTVFPIAFGFKDSVSSTSYSRAWKILFQFVYATCGVALSEELLFRGYLFKKLQGLHHSRWFPILVSSLLFGLFHIFSGSLVQVVATSLIGVLLCLFREKIKGCTLLSLIIAHGFYDAMIVLWVSIW